MQFTNPLDGFNFHIFDLGDMLGEIPLVDGLDIGPVVLDGKFFELGLILIVPSPQPSLLFFGECAGAGHIVLPAVSHLDVLGDVVLIGDFGVSLNHGELLLVLAGRSRGKVAALDLGLVKSVEKGQGDVLVLLMREGPVDPLLIFDLKILKQAQVDLHC